MTRRVLDVGQCDADHARIKQLLSSRFDVEIERAHDAVDALKMARRETFDLILVNRLFDADRGEGLELVRSLKADGETSDIPVMLVSNFPDAQKEAVELGAVKGFGKSELGDPATAAKLGETLGEG